MASTSMSGFAQSPYQADIFLEKPIYNPGELINGQVTLRLAKKLCCEIIHAQLYGSARVFFIKKSVGFL